MHFRSNSCFYSYIYFSASVFRQLIWSMENREWKRTRGTQGDLKNPPKKKKKISISIFFFSSRSSVSIIINTHTHTHTSNSFLTNLVSIKLNLRYFSAPVPIWVRFSFHHVSPMVKEEREREREHYESGKIYPDWFFSGGFHYNFISSNI